LPKDHKAGELKGRPIIASKDSAVRPLSQLLARLLNPLIKNHVNSHLQSTQMFISSLKSVNINSAIEFGSLDVENLYGSIPLDDGRNYRGLQTVICDFFREFKRESILPDLHEVDFAELLNICLHEDRYILDGSFVKQVSGIAMGNCAAPPLAILYMNFIEQELMRSFPHIIYWKRYIDDIFFICEYGKKEELLVAANAVNPKIRFTIESPSENKIPFLDTMVKFENQSFNFELYIKPIHSGTCLPFDASVPLSQKKSLVISETIRAHRVSTPENVQNSLNTVKRRLQANGYPKKFIDKAVENVSLTPRPKQEVLTYLRVPFFNDRQRQQVLNVARSTGLNDKLRIIFVNQKPLARLFRENRETVNCPRGCHSCLTARHPGNCLTKFVVYEIKCNICNAVYIGETSRSIRSRVLEHGTAETSHVHMHMVQHGSQHSYSFTWRIIMMERNFNTRLAIEALNIRKSRHNLMNGCEGRQLLPYLS